MSHYPEFHYYETTHHDGGAFPVCTAHETLDEAIEFAEAHGLRTVSEIGGYYREFEKCAFCGGWFLSEELSATGDCPRCFIAMLQHGG